MIVRSSCGHILEPHYKMWSNSEYLENLDIGKYIEFYFYSSEKDIDKGM